MRTLPDKKTKINKTCPQSHGLLIAAKLNEGAGLRFENYANKGNRLIGAGGVTHEGGPTGSTVRFNGSTGIITCTTPPELIGSVHNSLAFWARYNAVSSTYGPSVVTSGDFSYGATFEVNGQIRFYVCTGSTYPRNIITLSDTLWHHYAFVFDGTQSTDATRAKIYKDGVLQTTTTVNSPIPSTTFSGTETTLQLGRDWGNGWGNGNLSDVRVYKQSLTQQQVFEIYKYGYLLYEPPKSKAFLALPGAATHDTTGVVTGQGASVAGTAAHVGVHATTGVVTGQGASVSGAAARTAVIHATTGVVTGQGAEVAGTAARTAVIHATTGVVTGQGASVAGTAAHVGVHATTGVVTGQGAEVAGTAARTAVIHAITGVVTGQGASVSGTAAHVGVHATTGVVTGQGASVSGTAARTAVIHATTGVVTGQGASVSGAAAHVGVHATIGVVTGQGASVSGAVARDVFGAHDTTGTVTGQGASIVGSAGHIGVHATTGVVTGQGASVVGTAAHVGVHATTGVVTGQGSEVVGSANKTTHITHDVSGAIEGQGVEISGVFELLSIRTVKPVSGGKRTIIYVKKHEPTIEEIEDVIEETVKDKKLVKVLNKNKILTKEIKHSLLEKRIEFTETVPEVAHKLIRSIINEHLQELDDEEALLRLL